MTAKKILILIGIICVLLIATTYFFLSFYSEELGQALLARVSERTGVQLAAENFSLGLFTGVRARSVTARGTHEEGDYELAVESLVFKYQLLPLLYGTVSIDEIVLDSPELLLVRGQSTSGPETITPEPESEKSTEVQVEITKISVSDGKLLFREPNNNLEIHGLNVDLKDVAFDPTKSELVGQISGNGSIQAAEVVPNTFSMRELEGVLHVAEGILAVDDLFFVTDYGNLSSTFKVDLNQSPFHYDFEARGDPLDINQIVGSSGDLGPGRLEISGAGAGANSNELTGKGVLYLEKGTIPHHAVLEKVSAVLGLPGLIGSEYTASEAPFHIRNNRLYLESFTLSASEASLSFDGWADFEGPVQFDLFVTAASSALQPSQIPDRVLRALSDEDGQITVPLKVGGTTQNPDVRVNTELLMERAARQGLRNILEKIPNFPE